MISKRRKDRIGHRSGSAAVWAAAAVSTPVAAHKGAKSVSGYSKMRGFEGGQMPMHRRLPKRGFTNIFRKEYAVINLDRLNELEGDSFDFDTLKQLGIVKKLKAGLKILGTGELTRALTSPPTSSPAPRRKRSKRPAARLYSSARSQEA